MHLFLILSAPLAYVYILILRDEANQRSALTAIAALKGVLAYLVITIPLLLIRRFVTEPFGGSGVYTYTVIFDFAVPLYLGIILYLLFTRDIGGLTPEERSLSFLSFLAGAFSFAGLMDLFLRADYFGAYELFYLPALRISLMLLASSLLYRFAGETFWIRYLYLILLLATPFALATVRLLTSINYGAAAGALSLVFFLGGWAMALFAAGRSRALRLR
ncbi:MAG: hypothetical protein ACOC2N_04595 [Spirochaetota bacterium]